MGMITYKGKEICFEDVFAEGYSAAEDGEPFDANPYVDNPELAEEWDNGWNQCETDNQPEDDEVDD